MFQQANKINKQKGFLALTMILLVCATVLIIVTSILLRSIGQSRETNDSEKSLKAWSAVNACGEYALGQMVASTSATTTAENWNYGGNESLTIPSPNGEETCYIYPVVDSASSTAKIIMASSTVSSFTRKIVIEVATNTPSMSINSWSTVADFTNTVSVFTPASISGLSVWLDLSVRTDANDTAITTVSDLSGKLRDFTGNATIKTNILNGLRVARLTSSQTIRNNTNFGRPITVFYVARQNDTADGRLLSGVGNNWLLGHWSSYKNMFYAEGWVSVSNNPAKDADWHIWVGRQTLDTCSMWDGLTPVSLANPTAGTQGPNGLVFTGYAGSSERSNMDLAELVVYDSALSDADVTTVTNYLKTKYGL